MLLEIGITTYNLFPGDKLIKVQNSPRQADPGGSLGSLDSFGNRLAANQHFQRWRILPAQSFLLVEQFLQCGGFGKIRFPCQAQLVQVTDSRRDITVALAQHPAAQSLRRLDENRIV